MRDRELAIQKFQEFADKYDDDSDEWLDMDIQDTFVAGMLYGMREGMMRAADVCLEVGPKDGPTKLISRSFYDAIRAEAAKLEVES